MARKLLLLPLMLLLLPFSTLIAAAEEGVLHLAVGDPARKDHEAKLVLDAITDTATGEVIGPQDLAARLAGTSILFVGESHTSADSHAVELRVIEELARAGRPVLIGLEMAPYPEQPWLDRWVAGQLTEQGFLDLFHWYDSWGFPWAYYREIFLFARDHQLPIYALNAPRDVVTAVRKKGFKDLTPEEAAHIPTSIDTSSEEHRQLFRAFFDSGDALHGSLSEEQWQAMFAAQCTWDATMGFHAVQALTSRPEPGAIVVVLIGSGHVAYGLGIERQSRQWLPAGAGKMASLITVPVRGDKGEKVEAVRASYASFLWGVPEEGDPLYPGLGLSTIAATEGKGRQVAQVDEGGPAALAGVAAGDRLLAFDGQPLPDRETLNRLIAGKRWGDRVRLTVERGGQSQSFELWLRRSAR
ncbi:MAG TPA: ChaN family lipoprotein [Thermoanaerobaculia bacterium]|nr:ChaN family lipoprotein [Thermoanaerobaculia bacterium]